MKTAVLVTTLLLAACRAPDGTDEPAGAHPATGAWLDCSAPRRIAILPAQIREASGIAPSVLHPGSFWINNDSEGEPALHAIDRQGRLLARLSLPASVPQEDWEDIAVAPCGDRSCIYVADIGDNLHHRSDIAILRFPEPARDDSIQAVQRFPIRYPDGPHDAEAMFVLPDESVFIITKGRDGAATVYRYPGSLRPGTVTLQPVQQLTAGVAQLPDLVTGAAATPDGKIIAVRTYTRFDLFHFSADTLALIGSADLSPLREPQGEGISISADGTIMLVSETGPTADPPPLSHTNCNLPPQ
ncbi:MAG TPA: hypothetical protein VMN60_14005 [Longimicrobiales bacterium]|nr:hypothetical protein [Longimicrobiales bacterium]